KDGSPPLDLSAAALRRHFAFVVIVSPAAATVMEMQEACAALVGAVARVPTKLLLWVSLHSSATAADSAWPLFGEYPCIDVADMHAGPAAMESVLSQLTSVLALDASDGADTTLDHLAHRLFARLRVPEGRDDRQTPGSDATLPPLEALTRAKALLHREAYG